MTVRIYKSTDASAPTLSGSAGALITVLDAVLVNGYGSMTAAGWAKPYSGTNKAVYRMATSGNTGYYLNLQDNAPGAGGAREARIWGYKTASAQDTGTGQFPTTGQMANGAFVRKSTTADATARAWYIVADTSVFYLFVETGDYTSPVYTMCMSFGDFYSYSGTDANNCALIGRSTENSGSFLYERFHQMLSSVWWTGSNTTVPAHYVADSWTGVAGSTAFGTLTHDLGMTASNTAQWSPMGSNFGSAGFKLPIAYPNGPDSAVLMAPVSVVHNSAVRGYLKGIWAPMHPQPFAHADTFSGTGTMAGKSFIALNASCDDGSSDQIPAQVFVETSDTWS